MTDTIKQDLARRALASEHWGWMAGMLAVFPNGHRRRIEDKGQGDVFAHSFGPAFPLPVLSDPATLGCLLHLVREAWKSFAAREPGHRFPEVCMERVSGGYRSRVVSYGHDADGEDSVGTVRVGLVFDTEAEALVAALEAAPTHTAPLSSAT